MNVPIVMGNADTQHVITQLIYPTAFVMKVIMKIMEDVVTHVITPMVHSTAVVKKVLNWMLIEKAVMVS